jgi:hypothetical protein
MKTVIFFISFWISASFCQAQAILSSRVLIDTRAVLGEGSLWDPQQKVLYWVDIDQGLLHTYDPVSQHDQVYELGQKVGTVVPVDSGGVLVALKDGIYADNLNNKQLKLLVSPEKSVPENRFNDGKCDPAGRFWAGTPVVSPGEGDAVGEGEGATAPGSRSSVRTRRGSPSGEKLRSGIGAAAVSVVRLLMSASSVKGTPGASEACAALLRLIDCWTKIATRAIPTTRSVTAMP